MVTGGAVAASLDELFAEGVKAEQIVLLSIGRTLVTSLTEAENEDPRLGDGTEDTVLAETVRRFKELEAGAVILVLAERDEDELRRLAYVGMSRARSVLHVIGSKECRELIGWK